MKRALSLTAVAIALASLGACGETKGACDDDRTSDRCACAPDRRRGDGACCPGWTRFERGACGARVVTAPSAMQSVGAEGARSVTVAVDDRGRAALAWIVASGSNTKLVVAEEGAEKDGTLALREPAARLAGSSLQPAITAGPGERITVAWKQERSTEEAGVFVSERDDAGAWVEPQGDGDAFSLPPRAFEPTLLTAPGGEVLLAWNQWADPYFRAMVARRLPNAGWQRPSTTDDALSFPHFYVNAPKIAASPNGDVLISWYQAAPREHLMAYVSERRGASGLFSRPSGDGYLSPSGTDVGGQGGGSPKPALAPNGDAACAWAQVADDGRRLAAFLATRSAGGDWQKPASVSDWIGTDRGNVDTITTAFGARGSLYVVYAQGAPEDPAVYVLERSASGEWKPDARAPTRLSAPGARAQSPVLATGRDGAVVVAWVEIGSAGSALVMRRAWDGEPGWRPLEVLAAEEQRADSPALAFGGSPERLVVAWIGGPPNAVRVFAAKVE